MAAYATIFSSTIQPTSNSTNFTVSMTGFLVTVIQICKSLTKKGRKNNPLYNLGTHNFPKNTHVL
jgi:hypothetical protein